MKKQKIRKIIEEVIKGHTKIHYHAKKSCPQAIREELIKRIENEE